MADEIIPGADLPRATPGAFDSVIGVDESTGALRRFPVPVAGVPTAYETVADLPASAADGTPALVTNDSTAANNGLYRYDLATTSWVQSADRVTGLEQAVAKVSNAAGKINGWPDPFFRTFDLTSQEFFGRDRWYWNSLGGGGAFLGWSLVDNAVFDGMALRRAADQSTTPLNGPSIWLDEIGAEEGDEITVYALFVGDGAVVSLRAKFDNGSQLPLGTTATGGSTVTASATPQWIRYTVTVPAGAQSFDLYAYTLTASKTFDMVSVWGFRGSADAGPAWPTMADPLLESRVAELEAAPGIRTNDAKQIRDGYQPYVTLESVLGDAEMLGDGTYAQKVMVGYEQVAEDTLFNAIQWRAWAANASTDVEWKVFVRDSAAAFNPSSETAAASGTISAGDFPTSDTLYSLELDEPVFAAEGQYVFVAYRATDDTNISIKRWLYDAGVTPARHSFLFSASAGWNNTLSVSSVASGYGQTALKLLMESEELRAFTVDPSAPELVAPGYVFGVEGRECNVYFDNLFLCDAHDYAINVTATEGAQQNERLTWTPTGALAAGTVAVAVHEKRIGTELASVTMQQRAAAATAGTGLTKKCLFIGDSLIDAGTITQTILDVAGADVMAVEMLGTRGTGANLHEGRGGWSIDEYTSDYTDGGGLSNPFWIGGVVDFPQYLTDNTIDTPDWVFIHLGINDCFSQTDDAACAALAEAEFDKLDTLITSIKAAGAGVKVALMIPTPPSADQDAFGDDYGTSQSRWRFKRNILVWARELCERYNGEEANRIYVVPSNLALDTVNNMERAASAPVNSRSSVTSERQSNGVHPATSGYQQIGDAVWAFLKFYAGA